MWRRAVWYSVTKLLEEPHEDENSMFLLNVSNYSADCMTSYGSDIHNDVLENLKYVKKKFIVVL
jgi:hypothetical protein